MKTSIKIFIFGLLIFGIIFYLIGLTYSYIAHDNNCVTVKGVWKDQELKSLNCYGTNNNDCKICRECLHYSFLIQGKEFNYFAANEYDLRKDLKSGDHIRINLCWNDNVEAFLTKGVKKIE